MNDLILTNAHTMLRVEDAIGGALLHWEWQGCGGTLHLTDDQLVALQHWLDKRNPPQKTP